MKTKHLLYTAALAAMFAACTNDDFESYSQQSNVANDGRPTVSDVKLKFTGTEADTRLVFGQGGYAWQTTDTIGALLMDEVLNNELDKTWLEKYQLVNDIHTSYPFTYNTTDQTWGCNTKMLEGNYFFAFPWESYDGRREVAHSLLNQQQNGIAGSVVAESYAQNQFFIGYSQIMAGTEAQDVLNEVEMVPVLGAIQLRITNTGTQTYHINKVVLSGNTNIASVLTFDPTDATYGSWNLTSPNSSYFNYANYTGNETDVYTTGGTDYVYNINAGEDYDRIEALRAVVKAHSTLGTTEKSSQLTINGTEEERALLPNAGNTAYVLIMCNALDATEVGGNLKLAIYTDEGFVSNIDLTEINEETSGTDNTVVTNAAVTAIGPSVTNTIGIQIDDNSFVVPQTMTIYNADDLAQFIAWNTTVSGVRTNTATLAQDVTFTNEMLNVLKSNRNTNLVIDGTSTLTLAADVAATVLDEAQLTISTPIVVEGAVTVTEDSNVPATVEVAEGAALTIEDIDDALTVAIENSGTVNVGADATVTSAVTITNNGILTVAANGDCQATVTNNADAVINNNGYMAGVTNAEDATINMGANSNLVNVNNSGMIVTANGSRVSGTNNGEIQYVEGATITATGSGVISAIATGTIDEDTFESNITKIIVTGNATIADDLTFTEVELQGGTLTVNKDVTLTTTDLNVTGSAAIAGQGTVAATNVEVEENVTLTNNGAIESTTFTNNGTVANNGSVQTTNWNNNGTWRYNQPNVSESNEEYETLLQAAVEYYMNNASNYSSSYEVVLTSFVSSYNYWVGNSAPQAIADLKAYFDNEENDMTIDDVTQADLNVAVSAIEGDADNKETLIAALESASYTADATLYDTKDAANPNANPAVNSAYATFRTNVIEGTISTSVSNVVKRTANALTTAEIDAILAEAEAATTYIWEGCDLDNVVAIWETYDGSLSSVNGVDGNEFSDKYSDNDTVTANAGLLMNWLRAVLNGSSTIPAVAQAQQAIANLGITIANINDFSGYTNTQVNNCAE